MHHQTTDQHQWDPLHSATHCTADQSLNRIIVEIVQFFVFQRNKGIAHLCCAFFILIVYFLCFWSVYDLALSTYFTTFFCFFSVANFDFSSLFLSISRLRSAFSHRLAFSFLLHSFP